MKQANYVVVYKCEKVPSSLDKNLYYKKQEMKMYSVRV